jgi:hypothetical protein
MEDWTVLDSEGSSVSIDWRAFWSSIGGDSSRRGGLYRSQESDRLRVLGQFPDHTAGPKTGLLGED